MICVVEYPVSESSVGQDVEQPLTVSMIAGGSAISIVIVIISICTLILWYRHKRRLSMPYKKRVIIMRQVCILDVGGDVFCHDVINFIHSNMNAFVGP